MMAYLVGAESVDEFCRLSEPAAMNSLQEFTHAVVEELSKENLCFPSASDLEMLLRINTARGFLVWQKV